MTTQVTPTVLPTVFLFGIIICMIAAGWAVSGKLLDAVRRE